MGSLPNLHELGKNEGVGESSGYRPGPALGHLCGGDPCHEAGLTDEEKSKIWHRYSAHQRVTKARSNPHDHNKIVYDDLTMEHMASYSPISTARYNINSIHSGPMKRIDSLASSIGATSVRRLLAVVRGGKHAGSSGRNSNPVYNRKVLMTNVAIHCVCQLLATSAFLPFLALQSSMSVWVQSLTNASFEFNTGSLLVSVMYSVAACFSLVAPAVVKKWGVKCTLIVCYTIVLIFYAGHAYPKIYVTIPLSLLMGIAVGLLSCAHVSFLMILSHRIMGLFQDEDAESRHARKTCIVRRVARAFKAAYDFGLILGSIFTALLITFTVNIDSTMYSTDTENSTALILTDDCSSNKTATKICSNQIDVILVSTTGPYDYNSFLDDIFDRSEDGRLCGAQACPIFLLGNSTLESGFRVLPTKSAEILIGCYSGVIFVALILVVFGLDRIRLLTYQDPSERGVIMAALRSVKDSFRDPRLQMAAPLSVFIGIEQAFMFADFSKSYVVCTLGIHRLNLVFLSMGLLQSIAACTLSMLLRTIRRYYVVAVGFAFQICLIMVLLLWKPIEDDPALFYVISASWGVCNAIWEMMSFTFLTSQYLENWESAFCNLAFFKFLGLAIAFVFHSFLCNYLKLYILALLLVASVLPFAWLEFRLENIRKIKNLTRL